MAKINLTAAEKEIVARAEALDTGKRLPFQELGLLTEEDMRRMILVLIRKVGALETRIKALEP